MQGCKCHIVIEAGTNYSFPPTIPYVHSDDLTITMYYLILSTHLSEAEPAFAYKMCNYDIGWTEKANYSECLDMIAGLPQNQVVKVKSVPKNTYLSNITLKFTRSKIFLWDMLLAV